MLHQGYRPLGVLILLVYYNRPLLVRNALASILRSHQHFGDWELAVLDDGSEVPVEPIVRRDLADHLDRVTFFQSGVEFAEKLQRGVTVGGIANRAIAGTCRPVCVTLCDDDELHPLYLKRLDRFFWCRRDAHYCYSNLIIYNPFHQSSLEVQNVSGPYNGQTRPIECYGKVDGSQVAFRTDTMKSLGIWYPEDTVHPSGGENPFLNNLDGELFKKFFAACGPAPFTGFISQYKGVHEHQLVFLKEHVFKDRSDIMGYHDRVLRLAGEVY